MTDASAFDRIVLIVVTTANFDADGILSGTGGCNRYTTSYSIEDGMLSVALPASTLMARSLTTAQVDRGGALYV
jgi:hypothetical protein